MSEEIITREYVLGKLRELVDSEDVKAKDKLAALKMCGDYLQMFENDKVDLRALIAQLSSKELKGLQDAKRIAEATPIEAEVLSRTINSSVDTIS